MLRAALCVLCLAALGSISSAAIIYEPVQYQYRDPVFGHPTFYYGGVNPHVIDAGAYYQQQVHLGIDPNRDIVASTNSEGRYGHRLINHGLYPNVVTYTDILPPGVNAFPYGFNEDDARNEAYANVPTYFRKRDLLASAYRAPDGNIIVPAQAPLPGTIQIINHHGPTTQPSVQASPTPIMIIPKGLLNKRLDSRAAPQVQASAR